HDGARHRALVRGPRQARQRAHPVRLLRRGLDRHPVRQRALPHAHGRDAGRPLRGPLPVPAAQRLGQRRARQGEAAPRVVRDPAVVRSLAAALQQARGAPRRRRRY
ncbi:hypothetical protein BN1723_018812, partial [Verticillium longisporum]